MTNTKDNILGLKQVFFGRISKKTFFRNFFQMGSRHIDQNIWIFLDERVGNLVQRILVRLMPYSLTSVDSGLRPEAFFNFSVC